MILKNSVDLDIAFLRLLEDMFEPESYQANLLSCPNEKRGNKPDGITQAYECIHLNPNQFIQELMIALNELKEPYNGNTYTSVACAPTLSFIDVGCGVGQKVYMANRLFNLKSHGLELRTEHVKTARELLTRYLTIKRKRHWSIRDNQFEKNMIIQGNAITFDDYSKFDIIYFYRPSDDKSTETLLEQSIANKAKIGAVVIGVFSEFFSGKNVKDVDVKKLGWKRISENVWKKFKQVEA